MKDEPPESATCTVTRPFRRHLGLPDPAWEAAPACPNQTTSSNMRVFYESPSTFDKAGDLHLSVVVRADKLKTPFSDMSHWILEQAHPLNHTHMLRAKPELLTPDCHLPEGISA